MTNIINTILSVYLSICTLNEANSIWSHILVAEINILQLWGFLWILPFVSFQTTASKQLINTSSTTKVIQARIKHYSQNTNTVTSSFEEQQFFSRNSSYLPLGCVQQAILYQSLLAMQSLSLRFLVHITSRSQPVTLVSRRYHHILKL